MNIRALSVASLLAPMLVVSCGSSTPGSTPVDKWEGDATHLAISGSYQGQTFDVHLTGAAASGVYCNRYYAPLPGTPQTVPGTLPPTGSDVSAYYTDTSQYYFVMKEMGGVIDLGGTPTEFTISYWRHDMPAGTQLQVIPRVFGSAIPDGETWSDINLFTPGGDILSGIESAAASGTVSIEINTGTPDASGIYIPSGVRTGEYLSVAWGPQDHLNVSTTADCNPALVVLWPQTRLLPS